MDTSRLMLRAPPWRALHARHTTVRFRGSSSVVAKLRLTQPNTNERPQRYFHIPLTGT